MSKMPLLGQMTVTLSLQISTVQKIKQLAKAMNRSPNYLASSLLFEAVKNVELDAIGKIRVDREFQRNFNKRQKIKDAEAAARGMPRRKIRPKDIIVIPATKPQR